MFMSNFKLLFKHVLISTINLIVHVSADVCTQQYFKL